ncbi:hypothetical protein N7495_007968 [Penicillium taxi]|uniref:uncharacterized protein n=1 Tax=Penicillium taxi TaxID=168475 RepID=UPI0025454CFE|nr:uncharacterized protein N7495_007968 [Penicillium taxi]KAJ5887927.1 hypothetical protein N7495_007968 [Penicillium taxi]
MAHRGNWRSRGNMGNRGGSNNFRKCNQPEKLCTFFQRGKCYYGERCKYSHDVNMAADLKSKSAAYHSTADDLDARNEYFDWKRLLRNNILGSGYPQMEHEEILQFWNGALEILESDSRENHQSLAKDIVDDNLHGHRFILATVDSDSPEGLRLISAYDEPFLKVITHPSLLNCLSVDSFVGTLYTSFSGTNGDRAIRYLRSVCQNLMRKFEDSNNNASVISLDMVKLLLNTLRQLLSRVRHARFHDELPALLDLTRELGSKMTETCLRADLDGIENKIEVIQSLINSSNRNLVTSTAHEKNSRKTGLLSSFPMDVEVPGERHDNDLTEISQVQILPTYGEIVSSNSEYLPSTNFLQPHFLDDPLERYIDSTFRLLRYDIFSSAKDVLRDLLQQIDITRSPYLPRQDNRAHVFLGAQVKQIFINEKKELEATVSFSTPPQLRKKTSSEQCRWWQDSSRLEEGSLVCFLTSQGTHRRHIFLEVTVKNASKAREHDNMSNLVSDMFPPSITVKLAACMQQELILLGQLYSEKLTGILVDFHGLIPATFVSILKNLQRVQREGYLAFRKWVLPGHKDDEHGHSIPPPAYARKPGFIFPLASITNVGADTVALDPSTPESIDTLKLQTQTGLDHGQCQGLIAALTREYALIQGPPGTGKSYLGVKLVQVLLEIKAKANLGPIIVICYTNHALDQFLKHLLDVGIQKIIRMGGRSKATELEGKNLRVVSKDIGKTRVETQTLGISYGKLDKCMEKAKHAMKFLHQSRKGMSWAAIEHFVNRKWPTIHTQLNKKDLEGYTTVGSGDDKLLNWLGVQTMKTRKDQSENEADNVSLEGLTRAAEEDIHSLSIPERRILAISWFKRWQELETASLFEALDHTSNLREDINAVHDEINRRALIQADVVGITTTAYARHIETLRRIGAKIIICEEAAEVMEAHVISALMPGVEHFIQIGDHQQLRPQIQTHSLSLESSTGKKWKLDRSQFERRAVGEPGLKPAPVAQLNVQRRMRPEISQLIRSIYPKLEDHESVMTLPNVVGMQKNLFWLDHRIYEDSIDDGSRVKSHSNQWEVEMVTALVRHLVRQGEYKSTDIALLTPYTGQLRKLRASLSNDFEICLSERDLETLAADGFENVEDENIESNGQKTIEKKSLLQTLRLATVDNFQGEEAKVIVVSLVRSNSNSKVGFLRTENRINVLLSRAQHGMYLVGNTETYLNVPMWANVHSHLALANAVGTELALCCPRHPNTPILCSEPHDFERKSPEGGCSLPCTRRLEPCGHQCQAKCHSAVLHDGFACGKPCPRIRSTCEHECPKLCGEACGPCMTKIRDVELPCGHIKGFIFCHQMLNLEGINCDVEIEKTVPKCGHKIQVRCFKDVTLPDFRCPEPCPCAPCIERCTWSCTHQGSCAMPCAAPCNRLPCDERCTKILKCGHQCPSLCGEDCPNNLCQKCGDKGDARVDFLEWKTYSEINLDETPIIVLGCGHFFTSESVDSLVGLDEVYTREKDGKFDGLRDVSSSLASAIPSCPDCKQPIRQFVTKRYNRVINRAVADETCKRFLTKGHTDLDCLQSRLNDIENDLKSKPALVLENVGKSQRYTPCKRIEIEASILSKNMETENQPMKRLTDAVAIYQNSSTDNIASLSARMEAMNIATRKPDNQITISARLVNIKAREIVLSDIFRVIDSRGRYAAPPRLKITLTKALKDCRDLITQANEGNLSRIVITATISFAKIAQFDAWYQRTHPGEVTTDLHLKEKYKGLEKLEETIESTRDLLAAALKLCDRLGNCPELQENIQEMVQLYEGPRYETVTLEELQSIKTAMVSGRGGIATHSGHWYNCVNGHPVSRFPHSSNCLKLPQI